jgi:hypothetical protein
MSRVQLALNVADLESSIKFYSQLFATEPAKVRDGYANFAIANPPLKLVLLENPDLGDGTLNHLGVEVESTDEVEAETVRLVEAGLVQSVEKDATCCYATQDKTWVNGPGGHAWEIYTVKADSLTFNGAQSDDAATVTAETCSTVGCC